MKANYHLENASLSNTKTAVSGTSSFNCTDDAFVLLDQSLDLKSLRTHFSTFQDRLRASMLRGFSFSVSDFVKWNPDEKRRVAREGDVMMAFKSVPGTMSFQYFEPGPILASCTALGLIPRLTPHGKPRTNAPRGAGGLPNFVANCPVETQREVLKYAFAQTENLDDLYKLGQRNSFAFDAVEEILARAPDAWSALEQLLPLVGDFIAAQTTQWRKDKAGRRFAAPLFFAYLAGAGVLLWPSTERQLVYLVPDVLRPIWWEVLAPNSMGWLVEKLANARGSERATTMLRRLMLTSDIFVCETFDLERFGLLLALKHDVLSADDEAAERPQHEINVLVRLLLRFTNRSYEDIPELAANFGGGKRTTTPEPVAFGWVEDPQRGRKKYQAIFGGPPPGSYSAKIHLWAHYLRALLSGFPNRSLKTKRETLDYWLYYLTTLPDADVPDTFKEVERPVHVITSDPTRNTFSKFIEAHGGNKARRILSDVAQAWKIAAKSHNFSDSHNPIDAKEDSPRDVAGSSRKYQTRRGSMSEAEVKLVRAVNMRDDFAFARSLGRFEKKTRSGKKVFWPALPIILELILSVAMRSHSAIWADSGEGDEFWPGEDSNVPNELPTATAGRQAGILQRHEIDRGVWVLGMRLEVVKTAPYSTPWIDPDLVGPIKRMRDWQIEHNPRNTPIPAVRDPNGPDFNPTYDYVQVYPLFRDPESPTSLPPTWSTVNAYWQLLLRAAEKEANMGRPSEQHVQFFVDDKPIWDLHSLRVTFVTNARDAGIPLEAVQAITGQSAPMAVYYDVHRPIRAHQAFVRAKETERDRIAASLKDTTALSSPGDIDKLIGGALNRGPGAHVGLEMLHWAVQGGREVHVFSHGICPGARCDQGNGEEFRNKPVFRPLACSRCQFRVTGARFVNGLAIRANSLAIEQFRLVEEIRALNGQLRDAEDAGASTHGLQEAIERQSDLLEEVNKEWSVEYATCKLAERKASEWDAEVNTLPVTGDDAPLVSLEKVHPLTLIQGTLDASEVIAGSSVFIPPGTEELRNAFLHQISHHNNLGALLIAVDPGVRGLAMHKFGQLITQHAHSVSPDPAKYLTDLIDGSVTFDPDHRIDERLARAIQALTTPLPKKAIAS